jgi:pimeloyl-ACP methyl ester carboxylesterase
MIGRPVVLFLPAQLTDAWASTRLAAEVASFADLEPLPPPRRDDARTAEETLRAYEAMIVRRVEEAAATRPVVLAGASVGGYFAARAASVCPRHVAHLLLLGAIARLPADLAAVRAATAEQLARGDLSLEQVLAAVAASVRAPDDRDAEIDRLLSEELARLDVDALVWNLRVTAPLVRDEWAVRPFEPPATVIHGRDDRAVAFACAEELAALGSRTRLVALETSSHLLAMTHAARVGEELRRALAT